MPGNAIQLVRQNSKGLPIEEIFIVQQETECFQDQQSQQRIEYIQIEARIKKYGYGGITTLNNQHISFLFQGLERSDLYVHKHSNEVSKLLLTYFFFSSHQDITTQTQELWQIINPNFDDQIGSQLLIRAVKQFSKLAVNVAITLINRYKSKDEYTQHMKTESLKYLRKALSTKEQFLDELAESMSKLLSFDDFKQIVENLCLTPSQLRMAITRTEPSYIGVKIATSGPATIIISFLSKKEMQDVQLLCRKWYVLFVPQMIYFVSINKPPSTTQLFRLFTIYEGSRYYLGAFRKQITDLREEDKDGEIGRTTFISAGCSSDYQKFKWRLDQDGRLCLNYSPEYSGMPKQESYLGAHRTYNIDIWGSNNTYALVTSFKAHEGFWQLIRTGELTQNKCFIQISNNRCVNDKINHVGWQLQLPVRNISPSDCPKDMNWYQNQQRPYRNSDSVYVMLSKVFLNQKQEHQKLNTWTLEIVN